MSAFKRGSIAGFVVIIVGVIAVIIWQSVRIELPVKKINFDCGSDYSERQNICFDFVKSKMTNSNGGVYTNYLDNPTNGDISQGHTVLSESQGIMMQYFVSIGDKEGFDKAWGFVRSRLSADNGLISWRVSSEAEGYKSELSSSTVDDLRIIKALSMAWDKWKANEYYDSLKGISHAVFKNCVKNNLTADFYDFKMKLPASETNLSYLDLDTFRVLTALDWHWKGVLSRSQELINQGQAGQLPLFDKSFLWKEQTYKSGDSINMIESLLTYLYDCQSGKKSAEADSWLKERLKNNELFSYHNKDGSSAATQHSTAVYAIVCLIGSNNGDTQMYNLAMRKMIDLQITDKNSKIYGAFGDSRSMETFSFDNLMALLAFAAGKVGG